MHIDQEPTYWCHPSYYSRHHHPHCIGRRNFYTCDISTQILIQAAQRIRTEPSHECCEWAEELALPLERVALSWHYVQSELMVGWNNKRGAYLTGLIGVTFMGGVTISILTVMNTKHEGEDYKRLTTRHQKVQ